jgi:hypothetical protein
MTRILIAGALLALVAGCRRAPPPTAPAAPTTPAVPAPGASPAGLLGGERGLDHVNLATTDLAAVVKTLEGLGLGRPVRGRMPDGLENANFYFEDATYLEVLATTDAARTPWVPRFLARGPGLMKLVLVARSVDESAAFLRGRGVATALPRGGTIRTEGEQARGRGELWRKLLFDPSPLPCDCLFLIAYRPEDRAKVLRLVDDGSLRRRFRHPNTARGLLAVSFAVADLDSAVRSFERIGLSAGERFTDARLAARGRRIQVGVGTILLLSPAAGSGPVARLLERRGGPALLGASLAVRELVTARRLAEAGAGRPLPEASGPLGRAVLVPPEVAHGAWLELVESR